VELTLQRGFICLIDDEDYELIKDRNWHVQEYEGGKWRYAVTRSYPPETVKESKIRMHRFLLGAKPGEMVDHINANGLDNRRSNLRLATQTNNQANRRKFVGKSKFKGVSWTTNKGLWRAAIFRQGRTHLLGYFTCEIEAAKAYNEASLRFDGEFARLNPV
jgi:hypothetical protein